MFSMLQTQPVQAFEYKLVSQSRLHIRKDRRTGGADSNRTGGAMGGILSKSAVFAKSEAFPQCFDARL